MVACEERFLSDSASFESVFQIRVHFYMTLPPLLSFFINTTPCTKHFLRSSLRIQPQTFALHFFLYRCICRFLNMNTDISYFLVIIPLNEILSRAVILAFSASFEKILSNRCNLM